MRLKKIIKKKSKKKRYIELESVAKGATVKEGLVVRGVNASNSDETIKNFLNK